MSNLVLPQRSQHQFSSEADPNRRLTSRSQIWLDFNFPRPFARTYTLQLDTSSTILLREIVEHCTRYANIGIAGMIALSTSEIYQRYSGSVTRRYPSTGISRIVQPLPLFSSYSIFSSSTFVSHFIYFPLTTTFPPLFLSDTCRLAASHLILLQNFRSNICFSSILFPIQRTQWHLDDPIPGGVNIPRGRHIGPGNVAAKIVLYFCEYKKPLSYRWIYSWEELCL